jgi:hypothetical protein
MTEGDAASYPGDTWTIPESRYTTGGRAVALRQRRTRKLGLAEIIGR